MDLNKSETEFKDILLNEKQDLNNLIENLDDIEIKSSEDNTKKVKEKSKKGKTKSKNNKK